MVSYKTVLGEDTHFMGYFKCSDVEIFLVQKYAFKRNLRQTEIIAFGRDFFSHCSHFSLRVLYMLELHIIYGKLLLLEKFPRCAFRNMILMFSLCENYLYKFFLITQISN